MRMVNRCPPVKAKDDKAKTECGIGYAHLGGIYAFKLRAYPYCHKYTDVYIVIFLILVFMKGGG